jgi:hypothetical protein
MPITTLSESEEAHSEENESKEQHGKELFP